MTDTPTEKKPRKYYWVPENAMFENDGDCLDKFPDTGAAALVVDHTSYDQLLEDYEDLAKENEKLKEHFDNCKSDKIVTLALEITSLTDRIKFLRTELKLGCMCHALHPDFHGRCGACIAVTEDDRAQQSADEIKE